MKTSIRIRNAFIKLIDYYYVVCCYNLPFCNDIECPYRFMEYIDDNYEEPTTKKLFSHIIFSLLT